MSRGRILTRAFAAAAAVLAIVAMGAGPAVAGDTVTRESATVPTVGTLAPSEAAAPMQIDEGEIYDDPVYLLPTYRWSGSSGQLHSRIEGIGATELMNLAQRNWSSNAAMGGGNLAYGATAGLLDLALDMDPLNAAGEQADQVAAVLGRAMYQNSPVVVAVFVLILAGGVWQMARTGQRPWRKIITGAGIVALFAVMTAGASASTTVNGHFKPGLFSPGWIATKINDSVTAIASVPAQALSVSSPVAAGTTPEGTGCHTYLTNLATQYNATPGSNPTSQVLSSMWETSGLTAFKLTQYGATPINKSRGNAIFGDEVFCHQLDWLAGVEPGAQAVASFGAGHLKAMGVQTKSVAWGGMTSNDVRDQSLIAWAACGVHYDSAKGGRAFNIPQGFATDKSGNPWITEAACEDWWTDTDGSLDPAFNIGGTGNAVTDKSSDPAVTDFLLTLHGTKQDTGMSMATGFVISSVLVLIVFGGLSIAIIIAKLAAVVMVVSVFFVLLLSLASKQDMTGKMMQFLRQYLGYSVFAFGATLILSLVVLLSRMIIDFTQGMFGMGSFLSLLLVGVAPLIACYLLHVIFTKMFKLPGVFKPSSAFAWGAAGGAVGGALASRVGRGESRLGSIVRGAGRTTGAVARQYAMGRAAVAGAGGGRTKGRRGMMSVGTGGAAAAPGAAAGSEALAAVAAGRRMTRRQLDETKFDRGVVKEARQHAKNERREQRSAARAALSETETMTFRQRTRQNAQAAQASVKSALSRTRALAEAAHDDPLLAAQIVGGGMRDAIKRGGSRFANSPALRTSTTAAAKIGAGAAIGAVVAGPVGAAIGAGIGAQRARVTVRRSRTSADARKVSALLAHRAAQAEAEEKAAAEAKKSQRAPVDSPRTEAAEPAQARS